ncbi:hypothetical protein CCICO_08385 [Corynebacterium ciconiae DSM 44920]|uniref:hypothetical protein n=1 Tax=Corynebacterium ciconiae TaxID=227319 RepID=UPI00035FBEFB|nr:hypothetical protein [Corynebacterium ciconiae]WKD61690.1 hypothetical protein CCICO_08385 [Corynebacterium ciconiae DSM 44920]
MSATSVSWEIYEELRALDISDASIPDADIAGRKFRLGQAASWARWGTTRDDLAPITASSEKEFSGLAPLTTALVLFGVNWGGSDVACDIEDWRNFHTAKHAGDLRLSRSLPAALETIPREHGELTPAPYMTDVFKLVPTRDGTALQKRIKADKASHDHVVRCAELLEVELEICMRGNNDTAPLLVALGGHAYDWLTGKKRGSGPIEQVVRSLFAGEEPRIAKINHASASRADTERTAQLSKILANNAQSFK